MCDCHVKVHPRISCGGAGCHCHKTNIKNVPVRFEGRKVGTADILKDGTEITVTAKLDAESGKTLRDMMLLGFVQEFSLNPTLKPAEKAD